MRSDLRERVASLKAVCVLCRDIEEAGNPVHLDGVGYRSVSDISSARPLWYANKDVEIVVVGGHYGTEDTPAASCVMAAELRALGIPAENIIELSDGVDPWGQIMACAGLARRRGWGASEVAIIATAEASGDILARFSGADGDVAPFIDDADLFIDPDALA